jgi:transposase
MRTPWRIWPNRFPQLRPVAADSAQAEAVKVVTRAHKTLIWERTRHTQRLRHALGEYFPAALAALGISMPPMPWSCWPRHQTQPRRRG